MFAADTLSRAVDKHENLISEKGADIQAYVDMIVTSLPVSPEKTEQIRNATDADGTMTQLKETILKGWPEKKSDCPKQIQDYWSCRAELSVVNDIIFKGNKFVIPASMRKEMLHKVMRDT